MQSQNSVDLRDKIIEKDFGRMNNMQLKAVTTTLGPVLVLAGAGSGKTTVLVNRIACLVKYGSAYKSSAIPDLTENEFREGLNFLEGKENIFPFDKLAVNPAMPWEIMAITFTNKAANELKTRIAARLGDAAEDIAAGTFHSICGKILRRHAAKIGYTSHFTIYDTDDQKKLMKEIMKSEGINDKLLPVKSVLGAISSAKDKLISAEEYALSAGGDFRYSQIAKLYKKYEIRMLNNDAMDFDDMINNTVKLFRENPDVLDYYNNRYKYIMVDEYQDTNHAQYVLVSLLAKKYNNICVVGDDDQSIYRFRGATIENILSFEDEYKNSTVIRLEQNYRSTGNILDAANAVIKNNLGRKGKTLWTASGKGEKINLVTLSDEKSEAKYVADTILQNVKNGAKFADHAVLYRMNAQSNALENVFARSGISYRVIGGMRFFERKEIKDVLAYLHIINNTNDDLRLKRIINEPKRSIGDTTVNNASQISDSLGISLFEVFSTADEYPMLSRTASKLKEFCAVINELQEIASREPLHIVLEEMLHKTGYMEALIAAGDEEQDRVDNIKEFASSVIMYEQENEEPTLSGFLEEIALISDIDSMEDDDKVVLMTVHSAKGLEFENVFIIGMEDGIFPGNQSIYDGPSAIEEERRLAYVAITRAKKVLTVTNSEVRLLFGSTNRFMPSRFLREIPNDLCNIRNNAVSYGISHEKSYGGRSGLVGSSYNEGLFTYKTEKNSVKYRVGMNVSHKVFGEGVILSVREVGGDSMLEINFAEKGNKKLMANFAKLKII